MDPAQQKALVDAATEIVRNANAQGWTNGIVAMVFLLLVAGAWWIVKWLLGKIDKVQDFTQTTLVELQRESIAMQQRSIDAIDKLAKVMDGCLAKQGRPNDSNHKLN